jgi:hypothetical protein
MRKSCIFALTLAIVAVSCQKDYEGFGDISQCPELQEVIDKINDSPEIDDDLLLATLQTTGMVAIDSYRQKNNGAWKGSKSYDSASSTILCFENEAYLYSRLMNDPIECFGPYPLRYDAKTNTIYTQSIIHPNEEFKAVVKYFDGEIVILDGLFMPEHDMYNDDYAEYRYIVTYSLDKEMRENYEELL